MLRGLEMRYVGLIAWVDESTTLGTQNADQGFGEHRLGIPIKQDPIFKTDVHKK